MLSVDRSIGKRIRSQTPSSNSERKGIEKISGENENNQKGINDYTQNDISGGPGQAIRPDYRRLKILAADDQVFNLIVLEGLVSSVFKQSTVIRAMDGN